MQDYQRNYYQTHQISLLDHSSLNYFLLHDRNHLLLLLPDHSRRRPALHPRFLNGREFAHARGLYALLRLYWRLGERLGCGEVEVDLVVRGVYELHVVLLSRLPILFI